MKNILNHAQKFFGSLVDRVEILGDKLSANFNIATGGLEVEEFQTNSGEFLVPGEIISHKNSKGSIPTVFWCHGGPHSNSERALLTKLAKHLNVNVVGFDFRGSKVLDGYYKNIKTSDYSSSSAFYNAVDSDYGGGHMHDLQAVVTYITNKGIFDNNKFIIAGHSFGGYMVAMALTDVSMTNYFKLGIAHSGFYDLGEYKAINCDLSKGEILRKQSPMQYTHNIKDNQKIIIIHGGQADRTTLVSREGAEEFVNFLHHNNKNVSVYFNDNANHTNLDFVKSVQNICTLEHKTIEELMGLDSTIVDSVL